MKHSLNQLFRKNSEAASFRIHWAILLAVVVLVSGCTGIPGFGGDVIKVNQEIREEGDRDIVIIRDIKTIPTSPVLPNQDVQLSFIVENVDTIKPVKVNSISLFDAPLFKDKVSGKSCNDQNSCLPLESNSQNYAGGILQPKEQKLITFNLKSPDANEIGNLKTKVKLQFKLSYQADTNMVFQVPLVNLDEIKAKQLAGETLNLDVSKVYGPGPIEPDVELFGSPYILSGQPATFIFSVVNRGKGKIATEDKNQISAGYLEIKMDPFLTTKDTFESKIQCGANGCYNAEDLEFYKDKTLPLRLETSSQVLTDVPFRTLKITANVQYNYEFRDSAEIEIIPYGSS